MDFLTILLIVVVVVVCVLLVAIGDRKVQTLGIILMIIVFSYVCAIRPLTSSDTTNYYNYYNKARSITQFHWGIGRDYNPWTENWYINFCWLMNRIGFSFTQFLFFTSFLFNTISIFSIISIYKTLYQDENRYRGLISILSLFVAQYGILYSYVVVRGALALSFCLLSVARLVKKKYISCGLFVFLAIAFQNFSWVFLPIIVLLLPHFKRRNNKLLFLCYFASIALSVIRVDIILTRLLSNISILSNLFANEAYYDSQNISYGLQKGMLLFLTQNVYLLYLLRSEYERKVNNYFNILTIGSILATTINSNATIRITNYFFVFQLFLYAEYFNSMTFYKGGKEKAINSIIITIVIPVLSAIYMLRYCSII